MCFFPFLTLFLVIFHSQAKDVCCLLFGCLGFWVWQTIVGPAKGRIIGRRFVNFASQNSLYVLWPQWTCSPKFAIWIFFGRLAAHYFGSSHVWISKDMTAVGRFQGPKSRALGAVRGSGVRVQSFAASGFRTFGCKVASSNKVSGLTQALKTKIVWWAEV